MIDICRSNCSARGDAFQADTAFYNDAWQEEIAEVRPALGPPAATLALCICSNHVSTCGGNTWNEPRRLWNDPVSKSLPVLPVVVGNGGKLGGVAELRPTHAGDDGGFTPSVATGGMLPDVGGTPDESAAVGCDLGLPDADGKASAKLDRSVSHDNAMTSTTGASEDAHDSSLDVHPAHWHGRCGYVLRLREDAPPGPWLCHHFSVDGTHIVQNGLPLEHANRCSGELVAIDGEAGSFDALVDGPGRCMGLRKPDGFGCPLLLRCARPPPGPVCRRDSCPYLARGMTCPHMARSTPTSRFGAGVTADSGQGAISGLGTGPHAQIESSPAVGQVDSCDKPSEEVRSPGVLQLQEEHRMER